MILQSLVEYYERKAELGEIAPPGFEWKPIPFLIVIDLDGRVKGLSDTREGDGKKLVAKEFLVPKALGRSGSNAWQVTNLLWDHYGYVLGYPKGDSLKDREKRQVLLRNLTMSLKNENLFLKEAVQQKFLLKHLLPEDVERFLEELNTVEFSEGKKQFVKNLQGLKKAMDDSGKQLETFRRFLEILPEEVQANSGFRAVRRFYELEEYKKVIEFENWMDCATINGANLSFQIEGNRRLVLSESVIQNYQKEMALSKESPDAKKALCLVTGEYDYIERIHSATPLRGGQATGKLVGFQKNSGFDSYGKDQAFNAPVGRKAQMAYTTALNTLAKSDANRTFLGDTTILFWSDKENILEQNMGLFFNKEKDNPDANIRAVKQLYESINSGKLSTADEGRFFVLGLSPNAARISVRYWLTGTVQEFARQIKQHFDDLEIIRGPKDEEFFSLSSMLSHTVLDYKLSNIAPNLTDQVTEAVLKGTPYPQSLLFATIRRIRAERHITRTRAAIIKACIVRYNRFHQKNEEELTVSLDRTNNNPAYLLGRLFSVLERIQKEAQGIETIRDRYYGAFSSTPVTVYPQLMKLKNHHLAKIENVGLRIYYENLIGEIIGGLDGSGVIPRQFSLEEQGRFAVGYYHQRQDLFRKKNNEEN